MESFFKRHGLMYTVIRTGDSDRQELGLPGREPEANCRYIGFRPGTDIRPDDVLVSPAGDRFHVTDTETEYFQQQAQQMKAFCLTEQEYSKAEHLSGPVFNIGTAYGSVIGTQGHVVLNYNEALSDLKRAVSEDGSGDKEEMEKIVSLLEMLVNEQVPPTKGLFSRFSAIMSRHAWLSNSIAATVLSWLMSQIP